MITPPPSIVARQVPPAEPKNDRRDHNPLEERAQARSEWGNERHQVRVSPALGDLSIVELEADGQRDPRPEEDENRKRDLVAHPVTCTRDKASSPESGQSETHVTDGRGRAELDALPVPISAMPA